MTTITKNEKSIDEKPLITFALFAYNQEKFIREAVEGAFSQTYEPLEIILSDDCSTDNTFSIIQRMAAEYKGTHTIIINRNAKNLGIGGHVNTVASLACGDWIVMAGGDDISFPERVADSIKVVLNHGEVGGVFGRFHKFEEVFLDEGNWLPKYIVDNKIIGKNSTQWLYQLNKGIRFGMPGCTAMWNKKLFSEFSLFPDAIVAEDVVLGMRALICGLGIAYTSSKMLKYRQHSDNKCNISNISNNSNFARQAVFSQSLAIQDLIKYKHKYPSAYSPAEWRLLMNYLETNLFISTTFSRRNEIGFIRSAVAVAAGLKNRPLLTKLRILKALL